MRMIYFDNSATTALNKDVFKKMEPFMFDCYGNGSSLHTYGQNAAKAIDEARRNIANLLNCKPNEIYFTSGGTESDNWALKGFAKANQLKGKHIISTVVEHPAILETCDFLRREGFEITLLPVDKEGFISLDDLKKAIRKDTILISIMYANNEIGSIMPIKEIGEIARKNKIAFHTDAVQAAGSFNIDVQKENIDMLSMSGHKFYGPKGIGILYKRNGIKIQSFMSGGEQERGLRAGTLNTPGIVGISEALKLSYENMKKNNDYIKRLRDYFVDRVLNEIPEVILNGPKKENFDKRLPNNANFSFRYVEGEAILLKLDLEGICVSSGSACSSSSLEPSHVLVSTGMPLELAHGSIRLSFGLYNTIEEVNIAVDVLKKSIKSLREISPLTK